MGLLVEMLFLSQDSPAAACFPCRVSADLHFKETLSSQRIMVQLSRRCTYNIPAGFKGRSLDCPVAADLVVLIVAAIANGLIPVPCCTHTMLRVGMLQSGAGGLLVSAQQPQGPLLACWCLMKQANSLQRPGGQEDDFFFGAGGDTCVV